MSEEILVNGIEATTGRYFFAPAANDELAAQIREEPFDAKKLSDLIWWTKGHGVDDPNR